MRLRELGGAIARAHDVQVFVLVDDSTGKWLSISGPQARQLVDAAREAGLEEIEAEVIGDTLRIGFEHDVESEAAEPGPVCSECGEPWTEGHRCEEEA